MKYLSLAAIIYLAIMTLIVIVQPIEDLVTYMPDDAFYYLTHARAFAETGSWPSSGVHPLWAILLISVHTPAFAVGLCALMTLLVCVWLWRECGTSEHHLALALIVATPGFFMNTVGGMETGVLFLMMALCLWAYRHGYHILTIIYGALLVLARLEAVVLIGILYFHTESRTMRRRLMYGATAGLALAFLWNLSISGELFSTSARMKAYWATLYDPYSLFRRGMGQAVNWLTGISAPALGIFVVALLVGMFKGKWLIAGMATIVFVWARLEWVQSWHVAVAVPIIYVAIVIGLESLDKWRRPVFALVITLIGVNAYQVSLGAPYPAQVLHYVAGQRVRSSQLQVGSWNSGIIGWVNPGKVTNLDGLVNDEIHPWIHSGATVDYMKKRDIRYVADWDSTIISTTNRVRYGFPEGLNVKPISIMGRSAEFGEYKIWEIQ